MDNLPIEIFYGICDNLNFEDIKNLSLLSKDFKKKLMNIKKHLLLMTIYSSKTIFFHLISNI